MKIVNPLCLILIGILLVGVYVIIDYERKSYKILSQKAFLRDAQKNIYIYELVSMEDVEQAKYFLSGPSKMYLEALGRGMIADMDILEKKKSLSVLCAHWSKESEKRLTDLYSDLNNSEERTFIIKGIEIVGGLCSKE